MRRSVIRDRRGVTEIGRKSEGSLGCFVFGTGVIIALFHSLGHSLTCSVYDKQTPLSYRLRCDRRSNQLQQLFSATKPTTTPCVHH